MNAETSPSCAAAAADVAAGDRQGAESKTCPRPGITLVTAVKHQPAVPYDIHHRERHLMAAVQNNHSVQRKTCRRGASSITRQLL